MDKSIRDKELSIENLKRTLNDRQLQNQNLEEQLNQYKQKLSLAKSNTNNEHEERIARLNKEIEMLKSDLSRQIEQNAQQLVNKDINIQSFKQDSESMSRKLSELDYVQVELKNSFERIKRLEQEKMQANLEWKRKCEYLENVRAKESDSVYRQVIESRDQVGSLNLLLSC
jgi:hypothetical protein